MRPTTLHAVAERTREGDHFDRCLANFLDDFYRAPHADALSTAPDLLAPLLGELGQVQDAYLAATAEHLAYNHGFAVPAWTVAEERKLHRPWFASQLGALRALLLLESPAAFRSRNIFISANALTRA